MVKTVRALGAAATLTFSCAIWTPLNAMACGAGSGGTAATTGGGQASTFSSIGGPSATDAVSAGFVVLVVIALLAVSLAVIKLRPWPRNTHLAQLSPDGRYWWDGIAWHDGVQEAPPLWARSADGAYAWDGHAWLRVLAS